MTKTKNFFFIDKQDDIYTVSMTPELQDDLDTVGYVDFIDVEQIDENEPFLNLEAAKTVFEAQSPIKGKIVERNTAAEENPELLNSEKQKKIS